MSRSSMQIENEKKFEIRGLNKSLLTEIGEPIHIGQYYLDIDNAVVRELIINCYGVRALKIASEARVRVVNGGEKILFNIKSDGSQVRGEGRDVELGADFAGMLIAGAGERCLKKDRYKYRHGFGIVEIDNYQDRDLVVAEFEYEKDTLTDAEATEIVREAINAIDNNATIIDRTEDARYKNRNLACLMQIASECD